MLTLLELFSSLEVALVGVVEDLADLFLASNLGFNGELVARATEPIYRFSCVSSSKEVGDLGPLLSGNVQFVLDRVRIHDVREHGKFLFIVEVLKWIRDDLSIPIHHQDVHVFVALISLIHASIPKKNGHPPSLILKVFKADQAEVKSNVRADFPDLEIIARRHSRQEWNPARLTLPVQLNVKVGDLFQAINHPLFVPLNLLFLSDVEPAEGNGEEARIRLHDCFVDNGPATGVANLTIAALLEEEVDALEELLFIR